MPTKSHLLWHFQNAAVDPDTADIDIFDVIGGDWWDGSGTKATDFVKELRALTVGHINLHINSPGGYIDDALAMYSAIQQHPAEVTALIESQAASAASFVAMAADKILIAKNAKVFIHDAIGFGFGNAADFTALVKVLDDESQNIANIYAERTGDNATQWRDAMRANNGIGSSYRGQEAIDVGLADALIPTAASQRNLEPFRIAALAGLHNAGRTMSQRNLDSLHTAMDSLTAVHDATCDMGADCPADGEGASNRKPRNQEDETPEENPAVETEPADDIAAIFTAVREMLLEPQEASK